MVEAPPAGGRVSFDAVLSALIQASVPMHGPGVTLATAVDRLMSERVKRYGATEKGEPVDVIDDPLRLELRRSADCRAVLRQGNRELRELYKFWAAHDERESRSDLLSCKELIVMLQRAALVGQCLSLVSVKAFCMATLFGTPDAPFGNEHEGEHLVFGDFVEVLARCAAEYFKQAMFVLNLADQLRCVIEHAHQTCHVAGTLADLREPRSKAQLEAMRKAGREKERRRP